MHSILKETHYPPLLAENINTVEKPVTIMSKLRDYGQFIKLRLASLVVFSAAIGFVVASHGPIDWAKMWLLILGGFLVTGSSNGFNQIMEKNLDKLMDRTQNRPLPQERMSVIESLLIASIMGVVGVAILWLFMNPMSGILGLAALILYTLVYTPLKRITPFAVFVGAFPGAIPPLLGCVAATSGFGEIKLEAWVMFVGQFMWQFPHFWAIAWVLDDDYKKAGFQMLPSLGGRDKSSAFQVLVYTLFLVPISLLPVLFDMSGTVSAIVISACGVYFSYQAYNLYKQCTIEAARKLMFGSFLYLPLVQLAIMIGK
ncbi:MAG TPA: heme o synthase [Bacteroidia bacterium]|nr:heme o synthase [Bacteroidia bacterium]HRG51500.1 heme o synthase [Bacteroidia bacterium]